MKQNFELALERVLKHEGGYVDHPKDPGGATNLGITIGTLGAFRKQPVTKADVKALTREEAAKIYKAQYWDTANCDKLPSGVDYAVFDYNVNSGPARGIKTLQALVGANADGIIGEGTLDKLDQYDPAAVINAYCDKRLEFLQNLSTWKTFGKGWDARVRSVRKTALAMARNQVVPPSKPLPEPPAKAPPPPPIPPKKSKSLWTILAGSLTSVFGFLTQIDTWPEVAFVAILVVVIGIGLYMVMSGRIKIKHGFETEEVDYVAPNLERAESADGLGTDRALSDYLYDEEELSPRVGADRGGQGQGSA